MSQATYLMPRPDAVVDLSCMNISCNANLTICRDGKWVCNETVPADKKIIIKSGLCSVDLDHNRYDKPLRCPGVVDDKCGCAPGCGCSSADGGDDESAEFTEAQLAQIDTQVQKCLDDGAQAEIDAKAGG